MTPEKPVAESQDRLETGFETPGSSGEVRLRAGKLVRADRGRPLGGPRAAPEVEDLKRTVEDVADLEAREEMRRANREMRKRRKIIKQRAQRDSKLDGLVPPNACCLLCKRHKPFRSQWRVVTVLNQEVAMCVGCARVLKNNGVIK